jgi:DNA polymerase I-like protein with 3'-5' exonuclease and polymerase domains
LNGVTLGEQRGSPLLRAIDIEEPHLLEKAVLDLAGLAGNPSGVRVMTKRTEIVPFIFSYAPQDAEDRADYFSEDEDKEVEGAEDKSNAKTHGKTRRKNWKFWAKADIRKACRIAREGLRQLPEPKYHLWPKAEEVIAVLKSAKGCNFYFDIETVEDLRMTCFGFSVDEGQNVYVVPMLQTHVGNTYYYGEEKTYLVLHALGCALLCNTVVVHNSMFDLFVTCWRYGLPLGHSVFDSMLAHNRCYIETEKSLGHNISLYTDLPYHKNEGVFRPWNHSQAEDLYRYNGKDVYALTQLKPALEVEARKLEATESMELANRMVRPYLTATLQGMRYDKPKLEAKAENNEKMLNQIQKVINLIVGYPLNPRSSQQVAKYLYDKKGLGIKKPVNDPTNEKTLLQLMLKQYVNVVPWILLYRGIAKEGCIERDEKGVKTGIGGTLGFLPWEGFPIWNKSPEPRFTTMYKLAGTTTMRLACGKVLGTHGGQGQNWTKQQSKLIIPDKGKVFIQVDQAGAEALIVAYLCRPGQFRDIFEVKDVAGKDMNPHSFLAMHAFTEQLEAELGFKLKYFCELTVKDLAKEKLWLEIAKCAKASDGWEPERRYYFLGKQGNHSLNYDCKARAFRLNVLQKSGGAVNMSLEVAQNIITVREKLFPEIKLFHQEVVNEVKRTGMLRNLFGHPRVFSSWHDESQWKEWYAFKPQSTVGQITNYVFVEMQERIEAGDPLLIAAQCDMLNNKHDSTLNQVLAEDQYIEAVKAEVRKHMNRRLVNDRGEVFYMKSDAKHGPSWGDT